MSFFGNIGNAIKKGVVDIGHFAGSAASNPWVQGGLGLVTGGLTAPILAGVAGGLLKKGGNIGEAVKGGATGIATGSAGKGLGNVLTKVPGIGGVVSGVRGGIGKDIGGIANSVPGVTGIQNFLKGHGMDLSGQIDKWTGMGGSGTAGGNVDPSVAAAAAGGGGGGGGGGAADASWWEKMLGGLGGLGKGILNNAGTIGGLGLGALQLKQAGDLAAEARGYGQDALKGVQQSYADRAPLRAAGQSGMLNPQIMDLSHLLDHSGPYAKGILPGLGKAPGVNVAPVQKFT